MNNFHKLFLSILGCELVGILGTPFTVSAIPTWYIYLNKPFFSPSNLLFAPVWTILYLLMGISFFLVWESKKKINKDKAYTYFFTQLSLNFLWTFLFFGLKSTFLGLVGIIILLLFIVLTMNSFYRISKSAFYILIPYVLWVAFATLLNTWIYIIN